ncbi:hypothetical protein NDU88_005493 [Pleurodeles waltl]|uniref:Uncharacterized protein n=1 Tax=Pleurodeles waltl TaxID=8319 RepID=A0AAV7RP82_PLEWA|nr:hypothetical protein NDU88_005493 [Pleurodeles waltl]
MLLQRRSKKEQGSVCMLSQLDQRGDLESHRGFQSRESRPRLGVREARIPAACRRGIQQGYKPSNPEGAEALGSSAGVGSRSPKMRRAPDPGVRRRGCAAGRWLEPWARLGQILLPGACRKCGGLQFRESEVWLCGRQAAGVWGEPRANPVAWSLPETRRAPDLGVGGAAFTAGRRLEPEARLIAWSLLQFHAGKVCFLPACKAKMANPRLSPRR